VTGIQLLFWKKNREKVDQGSEQKRCRRRGRGRERKRVREFSNKVRTCPLGSSLLLFGV
jgi:hypothetical protein